MMRSSGIRFCVWVLAIAAVFATVGRAQSPSKSDVDVILWFDTEDYLSPADDDAAKRLADLLSARQIRATFKVVGEKARVLEARHRDDVIEALKRHDIGYHANFHSVHPTVSEYEANLGLLDGMAEFVRREGPGAADVRRIFSRTGLACYGQPGSSWAAQAIAALKTCGIENNGVPCYVDSGQHVGVGGAPFWYCGALVVYKMKPNETRMELFSTGGLEKGEKEFTEIAAKLRENGGGLISIFYHPCEWVTSEFWDGVNFNRGANPPREQWKLPAQRSNEETNAAFVRFEKYVDLMRAQPDVHFVTASQLPSIYPDRVRTERSSAEEVSALAELMKPANGAKLDDIRLHDRIFSPADQFDLMTSAVAQLIREKGDRAMAAIGVESLLGPDSPPPPAKSPTQEVPWPAIATAVMDVQDYLRTNHRVPSRVFIGSDAISPADFVIALADTYLTFKETGHFPATVSVGRDVSILTERFVSSDNDKLFSGWVIHKPGFRAPHIMEVARLQAWTFKPAIRAGLQSLNR